MAVAHLPGMSAMPRPVGLIASHLRRYRPMLATLVFLDNEHGEAATANAHLHRRVVVPVNAAMGRLRQGVRLLSLCITSDRHHHLRMTGLQYIPFSNAAWVPFTFEFVLYEPSRKLQAEERKAEDAGEEVPRSKPRRGRVLLRRRRTKPMVIQSYGSEA